MGKQLIDMTGMTIGDLFIVGNMRKTIATEKHYGSLVV